MIVGIARRTFLTALGGAAVAWPRAVRAQQPTGAMPVIGYLGGPSPEDVPARFAGLRAGLEEAGFVEGRNVGIEYRSTKDRYDLFPEYAGDLVRRPVDLIFAPDNVGAVVAKAVTKRIPIVFVIGGDPIALHLVASYDRPGANATGVSFPSTKLMAKRLQLMHEAVPTASLVAVLTNQANANAVAEANTLGWTSSKLGVQVLVLSASKERQIDDAFATLVERKAGALVVEEDAFLARRREQIIALAAARGIPAIYPDREAAAAGAFMTYGASVADGFRLAGGTIGRILKGEKPADVPVQLAVKTESAVNLKTARALGLTMPRSLLAAADEVIE